jgi:hypothetical protein
MFSAHRTAVTKVAAESLRIQFVFIPLGWTDTLQPLDRRVFGALKAYARQLLDIQSQEKHG